MVGLHALKSARSILAFRERYPARRIIVVLTGTDLYRDIASSKLAVRALEAADQLVTLQSDGIRALPHRFRSKAVAVIQSAQPCRRTRVTHPLTICVLGHLRYEKDPMRAAYAIRKIDPAIDVRVVQAGQILAPRFALIVQREMQRNPRYHYAGALDRTAALQLLARSDVLVQSSRMEGGANTICEAIACGVPVIASCISGNIGILGQTYPGLYSVGDTEALQTMIERILRSPAFYSTLQRATDSLKPLVTLERERSAWRKVLLS